VTDVAHGFADQIKGPHDPAEHAHTHGHRDAGMSEPTPYRILLRGRISDDTLAPYGPELVVSRENSTTLLVGPVRDAAHLHGIITHVTNLGIELISATTIDDFPTLR